MEFLEYINSQIASHPELALQLEAAFRLKFWALLLLALYFLLLPLREQKKQRVRLDEHAAKHNGKGGKFIA